MLVKSFMATVFLLTVAVPSLASQSFPKNFTCTPDQYYSGGYDFYQIRKTEFRDEIQFQGLRWWQNTTPHGIKVGQPILTQTIAIETILDGNKIRFTGFENSSGTKDDITVPVDWNGRSLSVTSKLFENDMTFDDGHCIAPPLHLSTKWKDFTENTGD